MLSCDLVIVALSYFISFLIKNNFAFIFPAYYDFWKYLIAGILVLAIFAMTFVLFKIHRSLWKYISVNEVIRIGVANVLATLILIIFSWLGVNKNFSYFLSVELIAMFIATLLMFSSRAFYRLYRKSIYSLDAGKRTVIIGAGDGGNILLREILQNPLYGYKIVGFIDDFKKDKVVMGYKVLGAVDNLKELKEKYNLELAIIAIRKLDKKRLNEIVDLCHSIGLSLDTLNKEMMNKANFDTSVVSHINVEELIDYKKTTLNQSELYSELANKTVLVTGAAGTFGSEICRQIVKFDPLKLVILDINENGIFKLENELNIMRECGIISKNISIIPYIATVQNQDELDNIFRSEKPDLVYHTATYTNASLMDRRPIEAVKNNIFGTKNIVETCVANKIGKLVALSTQKASNTSNVAKASMCLAEMVIKSHMDSGITKMGIVRLADALSPNVSIIPVIKKQIEMGGPVTIANCDAACCFMSGSEIAQLVLQAGCYVDNGKVFSISSGKTFNIKKLAEKMIKLYRLEPYKDIDIVEIGLRRGEKMFEELHLDAETFVKTKNDLIFENQIMKISRADIERRLKTLEGLLNPDTSNEEIKRTLLDLIITD